MGSTRVRILKVFNRAKAIACRVSDIKRTLTDPAAVVQRYVKKIKLAFAGEQTTHLTHGKLTVVSDLSWHQFMASTSWHLHRFLNLIDGLFSCLELKIGAYGVTNEGAKHAS